MADANAPGPPTSAAAGPQRLSPRYKGQRTGKEGINTGRRFKFPTDSPSSLSPSCPVEIRPHIGAALAADPAGEAHLDIGQSGIIGPGIAADRDGVVAAIVGAIDQDAAQAIGFRRPKRPSIYRLATWIAVSRSAALPSLCLPSIATVHFQPPGAAMRTIFISMSRYCIPDPLAG